MLNFEINSKLKKYDFDLFPLLDAFLVEIDADHAVSFDERKDRPRLARQRPRVDPALDLFKTDADVILAPGLRRDVGLEDCTRGFFKFCRGGCVLAAERAHERRGEK